MRAYWRDSRAPRYSLLFALPLFLFVPEQRTGRVKVDARGTLRELGRTVRSLGRYREIVKFLVARLIFNDGLVTIFAFGGIYAAGTFGMALGQVIVFGIALNVASGLGALVFGFVDDRIGGKRTIMVTLVGQEILRGKHISVGGVTPREWLHFIVSLLCHDIGYVRGVCRGDRDGPERIRLADRKTPAFIQVAGF